MSIFNSLGSNYSPSFIFKSLLAAPRAGAKDKLRTVLGEHYGGRATLTFKGRDALELAFKRSQLSAGSAVGINGFTCYVVYAAIKNAGYQPVLIDLGVDGLQYDLEQLKIAHRQYPNLKALVIQNSFGCPADMPVLLEYCRQQGLLVVEDLAHSLGAVYADGREAGTVGDFTMLTFSQDKWLDVVAGGVLIDRRAQPSIEPFKAKPVSLWQRLKLRFYPLWTGLIRGTYSLGIGRGIHHVLKKLRFLSTPMSDNISGLHAMSHTTAGLILDKWQVRGDDIAHRRQIAQIYLENLPAKVLVPQVSGRPSWLRFPILIQNKQSMLDHLRRSKIFIGDTWYDAPLAPKRYIPLTDYKLGSCPRAEKLTEQIVNLPTHRHITPQIAQNICAKIKEWLTLQQKP